MIAPEVDDEHRGSTSLSERHHEFSLIDGRGEDGIGYSGSHRERTSQRRVKLVHEPEPPHLAWPIRWRATQEVSGVPDPDPGGTTGEGELCRSHDIK